MSDYKVGDVLTDYNALNALPRATVVRWHGNADQTDYIVAVKSELRGYAWLIRGRVDGGSDASVPVMPIRSGERWEILYLPPAPAPKVGDIVDTEAAAAQLPVGSVVLDDDENEDYEESRPVIKVAPHCWMFYGGYVASVQYSNDDMFDGSPHRVIHLPNADAGAGGQAA